MKRIIQVTSSFFAIGSYWDFGTDGYIEDVTIEYPEELDCLSDWELNNLIDEGDNRVKYE